VRETVVELAANDDRVLRASRHPRTSLAHR
jgi:hypothetical protein